VQPVIRPWGVLMITFVARRYFKLVFILSFLSGTVTTIDHAGSQVVTTNPGVGGAHEPFNCLSTNWGLADSHRWGLQFYYERRTGHVGHHLEVASFFRPVPPSCTAITETSATSVLVTGFVPPGLTGPGKKSNNSDIANLNFHGTPTQPGRWNLTVNIYAAAIGCNDWKTYCIGNRAASVTIEVKGDAVPGLD
jgi:hypothetical protein